MTPKEKAKSYYDWELSFKKTEKNLKKKNKEEENLNLKDKDLHEFIKNWKKLNLPIK